MKKDIGIIPDIRFVKENQGRYLAKPYSLRELSARVNALMRRTYGETEGQVLSKEELLHGVREAFSETETATVAVHIR